MVRKIFLFIMFCLLCLPVFSADDLEDNIIHKGDVFENNYQNIKETSSMNLSPTERIFNKKESILSGNILYQQGYNFNTSTSANNQSVGKYGKDYKLSIGEKLNVYSYGNSVDVMAMSGNNLLIPATKAEVDSNGSVYISGVGLIKAENRTLKDVERDANYIAKQKYTNVNIRLTIASGAEFSVFVYGEVNNPGKVYIGNNSSILDALSMAGGVKKTGTLRDIRYNKTKIDLYKTLFLGDNDIKIVKPNDVIFVGKIGNTAAVKNGVQVPGIYEMKPGETIHELIIYAGGSLPSVKFGDILLTGFDENLGQKAAKNLKWQESKNIRLSNGDSIEIMELYNGVENTVTLQGSIKHPATYAYKDGMRLSDILKSKKELLEETFINQAVIRRVSDDGDEVKTIPVFLSEFFAGINDPILYPRDVITVYKSTNSQFVDIYGCINTPKHLTYVNNMTLNDVMSDVKFLESSVEKTSSSQNPQVSEEDENIEGVQLSGGMENTSQLIPAENVAVEITSKDGSVQVYYIYDIMINSDKIKSIKVFPEDKIFFRTLRGNEILKTVKISGFVKEPGVYKFVKGQKLVDLINMAGGITDEADLRGLVFKRENLKNLQSDLSKKNNDRDIRLLQGRLASGYKQSENDQKTKMEMIEKLQQEKSNIADRYNGQISLNIKSINNLDKISKLDNIEVQDGDDIYIPRLSNYVSVLGEVYNEQAFVYKEGAKAKYYIKEVGGYTPNANKFRIYKISVNGAATKIGKNAAIEPGDTIVVPRKIAGNDWITPITQTLQSISNLFIMAFAIHKW